MLGVPAHTLLAICSTKQNNGIPFKEIWQGARFFSPILHESNTHSHMCVRLSGQGLVGGEPRVT